MRCAVDTRRSSDIYSTEVRGGAARAGGVRYSTNMGDLQAHRDEDQEVNDLIQERDSLRYLVEGLSEEHESWKNHFKKLHVQHSDTVDRLPSMRVAREQAERDADEARLKYEQFYDEYEWFKNERANLQEQLAEARRTQYQIEEDRERTDKALREMEGVRRSQAHAEKGTCIYRVNQATETLEKMKADLAALNQETDEIEAQISNYDLAPHHS